jgi:hypothetical protein
MHAPRRGVAVSTSAGEPMSIDAQRSCVMLTMQTTAHSRRFENGMTKRPALINRLCSRVSFHTYPHKAALEMRGNSAVLFEKNIPHLVSSTVFHISSCNQPTSILETLSAKSSGVVRMKSAMVFGLVGQ